MFGSNDDKKTPAEAGEKKGLFGWLRKKPQTPAAEPPATEPPEESQPLADEPDREAEQTEREQLAEAHEAPVHEPAPEPVEPPQQGFIVGDDQQPRILPEQLFGD